MNHFNTSSALLTTYGRRGEAAKSKPFPSAAFDPKEIYSAHPCHCADHLKLLLVPGKWHPAPTPFSALCRRAKPSLTVLCKTLFLVIPFSSCCNKSPVLNICISPSLNLLPARLFFFSPRFNLSTHRSGFPETNTDKRPSTAASPHCGPSLK